MKIFEEDDILIKRLEQRSGIVFSPTIIKLFHDKGYIRIKNTLIFMKQNNIIINNKSIGYIYRADKHLRHMLMPRIESFEIKLRNHLLHVITKVAIDGLIFKSRTTKRIYIETDKTGKFIKGVNKSLTIAFKRKYNVNSPKSLIFDWIHKLMLGDVIRLFDILKPKYKKEIFKSAFDINIDIKTIQLELTKIRKLRNKIAHAEQLYSPKGTACKHDNKSINNYVLAIKQNINMSQIKETLIPTLKFIDEYLLILKKYKI